MGRDKTDTIKQRRIDVYLPSLEAKERWSEEADERNTSVSKMVFQIVEESLAGSWEDPRQRIGELQEEVEDLTSELARTRGRIRELEALYQRAERDLEEYRAQGILGPDPIKQLDPRLIRVLSEARGRYGKQRVVSDQELRESLGIGDDDGDRLKALQIQLEQLELHGVVRPANGGWVWDE